MVVVHSYVKYTEIISEGISPARSNKMDSRRTSAGYFLRAAHSIVRHAFKTRVEHKWNAGPSISHRMSEVLIVFIQKGSLDVGEEIWCCARIHGPWPEGKPSRSPKVTCGTFWAGYNLSSPRSGVFYMAYAKAKHCMEDAKRLPVWKVTMEVFLALCVTSIAKSPAPIAKPHEELIGSRCDHAGYSPARSKTNIHFQCTQILHHAEHIQMSRRFYEYHGVAPLLQM